MSNDILPKPTLLEFAAHETLVNGLRNAHALEKQQIRVLDSHLELFAACPELHARVTQHLMETREQARRLEAALEACGASASIVKEAIMSVMGLSQSSLQSFGEDAEFKAVTADIMQEHLEIATYRMLIALAGIAGMAELRPRLLETLREEEAMAVWFDEHLEVITNRFIEIKTRKQRADIVAVDDAWESDVSPTSDGEQSDTLWQQLEKADQYSAHPRSRSGNNAGTTSDTMAARPASDARNVAHDQTPTVNTAHRGD